MSKDLSVKELFKIVYDCGLRILFASILIAIIYGIYEVISANWQSYILPVIIEPIMTFSSKNLTILTIIWSVLTIWNCCIITKILINKKRVPKLFNYTSTVFIFLGCILIIGHLSVENMLYFLFVFIVFLYSTLLFIWFFIEREIKEMQEKSEQVQEDNQLKLDV